MGKAAKRVENTAAQHQWNRSQRRRALRVSCWVFVSVKRGADPDCQEAPVVAGDRRSGARGEALVSPGRPIAKDGSGGSNGRAIAVESREQGWLGPALQVHRGPRPLRGSGGALEASTCRAVFRVWPTDDGMVEGRFKVTPEVGGADQDGDRDGTAPEFRDAQQTVCGSHRTRMRLTCSRPMLAEPAGIQVRRGHHAIVLDHEVWCAGT